MNGKTGLPVVGVVEVEYLIEGGNVINPDVHIHIIKPAMEMIMNIKVVMTNVVQVRIENTINNVGIFVIFTEKPYWGYWGQWSVCSKTCGGGISFRKRQCYQSKCPHPIYKKCSGNDYEEMKCNDRCCPG